MSNQDRLDEVRNAKGLHGIEQEIATIEARVTAEVAAQATESIFIEEWGTFYRRGNGWNGPGGYYGPGTNGAIMCEEALKNRDNQ